MAEAIEVYFLFSEQFTDADKVDLYRKLVDDEQIESSKSGEFVEDRLANYDEALVNFVYGSVHGTFVFHRNFEGLPEFPSLKLYFEQKEFQERHHSDDEIRDHVDDVVSLVIDLYEAANESGQQPKYVVGGNPTETEHIRTGHDRIRTTEDGVEAGRVEELYWLQIFTPEMVDFLGEDVIQSAPAWRIETLDDGAVLLVSYENPMFIGDDYFDLLEHLSLDRD